MTSIRYLLNEFRQGVRHRYPPCCIARYLWDQALGRYPAIERNGCYCRGYIPCAVFHRLDHDCETCSIRDHVAVPETPD